MTEKAEIWRKAEWSWVKFFFVLRQRGEEAEWVEGVWVEVGVAVEVWGD